MIDLKKGSATSIILFLAVVAIGIYYANEKEMINLNGLIDSLKEKYVPYIDQFLNQNLMEKSSEKNEEKNETTTTLIKANKTEDNEIYNIDICEPVGRCILKGWDCFDWEIRNYSKICNSSSYCCMPKNISK